MILAITTVLILSIKCTATFNMRSLSTCFVLLTSTMTSAPTFTKLSNLTLSSLNVPIAAPTKRQNIILYLLQSSQYLVTASCHLLKQVEMSDFSSSQF